MYVRDLEEGCLLRPESLHHWNVKKIYASDRQSKDAIKELSDAGIHLQGCVRYKSPAHFGKKECDDIGIYIGVKELSNFFYGVKKQHIVMVGSSLFVMDGYAFKDIKKV